MSKKKKISRKKKAKMQKKRIFSPAEDLGLPGDGSIVGMYSRIISEAAHPEVKDMTDEEYEAWCLWHWETIGQYEIM